MTKTLLVTPIIAVLLVAIPAVANAQYTTSNGTLLCNAAICDTQGFRDLGGAFNKVTGYSYNQLGVFIPWATIRTSIGPFYKRNGITATKCTWNALSYLANYVPIYTMVVNEWTVEICHLGNQQLKRIEEK
jgi:hypothetical protein